MPSNSLRESEASQLAFRPNIWDTAPADARCYMCTWVYAPKTSPYKKKAPWGLKFKSLMCMFPHKQRAIDVYDILDAIVEGR